MSTVLTVAVLVVAGLALAVAVAIPTGKYLHRLAHREGVVNPADCAPWCVRERADRIRRDTPQPRGAHRRGRRT